MQFKQVLIVGPEDLLISGLLTHLQDQGNLFIQKFAGTEFKDIISEIRKTKPDVVVMDDSFSSIVGQIFSRLPDVQDLNLVIINSKENKIRKINTQKIEVHSIEDFINVI